MDETQIKNVVEAALLAAGRPLPFDTLASLFTARASELDKETLQNVLGALAADYQERGLELKEVASGYRIQIRRSMSEWLTPLWEERAPRYTRALLETLVLVAYRQPITRAEIEEVRGVAVSTNIMRTLVERSWVRVVGHRDVPGKPAMFGTTREFLDYFGLKKLEDLPPLADIKDGLPELVPQSDLIDALEVSGRDADAEGGEEGTREGVASEGDQLPESAEDVESEGGAEVQVILAQASASPDGVPEDDDSQLAADAADEEPEVASRFGDDAAAAIQDVADDDGTSEAHETTDEQGIGDEATDAHASDDEATEYAASDDEATEYAAPDDEAPDDEEFDDEELDNEAPDDEATEYAGPDDEATDNEEFDDEELESEQRSESR